MNKERMRLLNSLLLPALMLIGIWVVKGIELLKNTNFYTLGIKPLSAKGLIGIITSPFIHGDLAHISANSLPLFMLSWGLFYFYKEIAWKVFVLIYLITGIWVWVFARDAYHIGASGIIYGLAAFLFISGVLRKDMRLAAVSMLIIFLYGGMIWGIMPIEERVSWEAHFMGMLSGFVVGYFFKSEGPQRKKYSWEIEEEMEAEKEKQDYEAFEKELEEIKMKYIYKRNDGNGNNKSSEH